ncbi:MAG: transporter substrate-binding domain-containing protein [Salinispira sp.]
MKNTKIIQNTGLLILLACAFLIIACAADPDGGSGSAEGSMSSKSSSLDRILADGVIRVGTTGDYYMSFIDSESGERGGHDIDVVSKLAADMGVEVEWVPTDWANLLSGIVADKYDITTSASFNMGRAKTAGYTLPIIGVGTVPLVLAENAARYSDWDDVNDPSVIVAARLGTVFEDQARALVPSADLRLISSPATEYQEVLAGKADVAITSLFDAANLVGQYSELAIAPVTPAAQNAIGILTPRDDQELINYINVWITMQERNGFFEETRRKWNLQ